MDIPLNPLEQVKALLGEHYENYVVAVVHPEGNELEFAYDNQYACVGIVASMSMIMNDMNSADHLDWEDEAEDVDEDVDYYNE
tara:strand:- start:624 stop:872 length:249 start_codon:yes stop_codon:yes gene_type:complete